MLRKKTHRNIFVYLTCDPVDKMFINSDKIQNAILLLNLSLLFESTLTSVFKIVFSVK